MIVTVTLNPAVDQTWTIDRLVPGASHRVPTGVSRAGGKGVNVARVLHATGHDVLAVAPVGGATGRLFEAELAMSGIPNRVIPVRAETRRSIAVVVRSSGEATLLNETGALLASEEADAVEAEVLAAPAAVVAICGSLPPGYAPERIGRLVSSLRRRGASVIVDTSGPALMAAARAGADLLKPNREELAAATGVDGLESGIRALLAEGAAIVVASDGEAGLTLARGDQRWHARLNEPIVDGNPTGAGDAAVASLAAHMADSMISIAHRDAEEALVRRAVAWSASAVTTPLAGEIAREHGALLSAVIVTRERSELSCP